MKNQTKSVSINRWIDNYSVLKGAASAFSEQRFEDAARICTEHYNSCDINEGRGIALLLRSRCFMALNRPSEAVYDHNTARCLMQPTPMTALRLGYDAMSAGLRFDYCVRCFEQAGKALEKDNTTLVDAADAYNMVGICHYRSGSPVEYEIASFTKGMALMKEASKLRKLNSAEQEKLALIESNLAECYGRSGNFDKAKLLFSQSSDILEKRIPKNRSCLQHYLVSKRGLAEICVAAGNDSEAHAHLTDLIKVFRKRRLKPDERKVLSSVYNFRGTLSYRMNRFSDEVSDLTKAIKICSGVTNDPNALYNLYINRAEAYQMMGDHRSSARDFAKGILLQRSCEGDEYKVGLAENLLSYAGLLENMGNHADAAVAFSEAAGIFADVTAGHYHNSTHEPERVVEMEALSRFRLGFCLLALPSHDYHECIQQHIRAARLILSIPFTSCRLTRAASIVSSLGELFELFDAHELSIELLRFSKRLAELASADKLPAHVAPDDELRRILDISAPENGGGDTSCSGGGDGSCDNVAEQSE